MAKTANINIRINPEIKKEAEKLFSNFGMTISDAINIFIHQSLLSEGLPFSVKLPKPNEATLAAMSEIEDFINKKTSLSPQNVDDFFKELNTNADS